MSTAQFNNEPRATTTATAVESGPVGGSFPQFSLVSKSVSVLYTPDEFRHALIHHFSSARRRIVLAALYIGTGAPEREVLDAVSQACRASCSQTIDNDTTGGPISSSTSSVERLREGPSKRQSLEVDILLDASRGRREETTAAGGKGSSVTMLQELLELKRTAEGDANVMKLRDYEKSMSNNGDLEHTSSGEDQSNLKIRVGLFHTPLLSGVVHSVLPARLNEVLGVFHGKIFISDNTVILSGANLSASYLTTRQDRYVVIEDAPLLATFLQKLVRLIHKFSFDTRLRQSSHPTMSTSSNITSNVKHSCDDGTAEELFRLSRSLDDYVELRTTVPCPIHHPNEFKELFGRSVANFLKAEESLPSSVNDSSSSSLLEVGVQIGFTYPPIMEEERMVNLLLCPLSQRPLSTASCRLINCYRNIPPRLPADFDTSDLSFKENIDNSKYSNTTRLNNCQQQSADREMSEAGVAPTPTRVVLASGYLNMPQTLLEKLASSAGGSPTRRTDGSQSVSSEGQESSLFVDDRMGGRDRKYLDVFMAAPSASSFHQSKGLSKYVPAAYSYVGAQQIKVLQDLFHRQRCAPDVTGYDASLSGGFWKYLKLSLLPCPPRRQFPDRLQKDSLPLAFWEYERRDWTFHSKGIWVYSSDENCYGPFATVIGSSNFGVRSRERDVDISFMIRTRDPSLQRKFEREVELMRVHSHPATSVCNLESRCPRWLRMLLSWTGGLKSLL